MHPFLKKLQDGQLGLGTCISVSDACVVEALAPDADFLWIDTEHSPMTLEHLKGHLMAVKGSQVASLVRVPWNDPVLMKPVLDLGADGIIVPMIQTADDVRRAVSACRYPPVGERGFGPLRPLNYGRTDAEQFCKDADESIMVVVQIEQVEAVENIDDILSVPGLSSLAFGPMDLSASLGVRAQPSHPKVLEAVRHVVKRAQAAEIPTGVSFGSTPEAVYQWIDLGVNWIAMGVDVTLMIQCFNDVAKQAQTYFSGR
mgnify:CR=1 FL=1